MTQVVLEGALGKEDSVVVHQKVDGAVFILFQHASPEAFHGPEDMLAREQAVQGCCKAECWGVAEKPAETQLCQ